MKLLVLKPQASFSHILGIKFFQEKYDNNELDIQFFDYPQEILNHLSKDKRAFGLINLTNHQNQINNQLLNLLEQNPTLHIWDHIQLPTSEFICNQESEFHTLSLTPEQFHKHYQHLSKKYSKLNLIQVPNLESSLELSKNSASNACIANQYQAELQNLQLQSEPLSPNHPDQKFIILSQQTNKTILTQTSCILTPTKYNNYYSLLPILHIFRDNQIEINYIQEFKDINNQTLFYLELEGNPKQARFIKSKLQLEKDLESIHLRFIGGQRKR